MIKLKYSSAYIHIPRIGQSVYLPELLDGEYCINPLHRDYGDYSDPWVRWREGNNLKARMRGFIRISFHQNWSLQVQTRKNLLLIISKEEADRL